jgi:hypothetical protein
MKQVTLLPPKRNQFSYAARPVASARHAARRAARRLLLRLRRTSGCFGTSRGLSRVLSCHPSSTTSPCAGSSSTTSRVRVPRHIARLITWLVIDYFASAARLGASTRHAYAARPGASARRAACHAARHRLLHLRAGSSSTTSPTPRVRLLRHVAWLVALLIVDYFASRRLVIDYFTYAVRLGASARHAARHAARRAAHRQLLRLAQACRRLLRLA